MWLPPEIIICPWFEMCFKYSNNIPAELPLGYLGFQENISYGVPTYVNHLI